MHNGPEYPKCGEEPKLGWLIDDKCENMGLRCRLSRVASVLCFLVVALLLLTLAFGSFVKTRSGPPAAKVYKVTDSIASRLNLTYNRKRNVQTAMSK